MVNFLLLALLVLVIPISCSTPGKLTKSRPSTSNSSVDKKLTKSNRFAAPKPTNFEESDLYEAYIKAIDKVTGTDRAIAVAKVIHSMRGRQPSEKDAACSVAIELLAAESEKEGRSAEHFVECLWVVKSYLGQEKSPLEMPFENAIDKYFDFSHLED